MLEYLRKNYKVAYFEAYHRGIEKLECYNIKLS